MDAGDRWLDVDSGLALLRHQFLYDSLRSFHVLCAVGPFHQLYIPVIEAIYDLFHRDTMEILELHGAYQRWSGRRRLITRVGAEQCRDAGHRDEEPLYFHVCPPALTSRQVATP